MRKKSEEDAGMQPVTIKPSRYRQARDGLAHLHHTDKGEEPVTRPATATSSGRKSCEQNPSIARSMSRYRRNRPFGNGNGSVVPTVPRVPATSDTKPPQLVPNLRGHAEISSESQGDHEREVHRQYTMEQLTGGCSQDRIFPTKEAQPRREPSKQEPERKGVPSLREDDCRGSLNSDPIPSEGKRMSFLQKMKLSKTKDATSHVETAPQYIAVGGGGIVPGTDAPVSAVNSGDRHVIVQYSDTALQLPVTRATRAQDVLLMAQKKISPSIDAERFILIESFRQIGLERPLRRYERVRDVMNSWAHDLDNRLIIIPPSSMEALAQIDAQVVPSEKPIETTVQLYHSQRPGKWEKRFVTLRVDGQVVVSKKENSKDHANICHLSDFDIYSPSARALAKDIRPPKKLCLAIKSQEKSSMFLSTENFVHFFATNDRTVAHQWHQAVQEWRSWYLVNRMGAGQPVEDEMTAPVEPLMHLRSSTDKPRPSSSKDIFSRRKTVREHASPPTSFPKGLSVDTSMPGYESEKVPLVQGVSPEEVEAETFSPAGLLGRTYTLRRQALREREEREKKAKQEPFSSHGLLNGMPAFSAGNIEGADAIRPSTASHAPAAAGYLGRGHSVNQKNKPLVDLTPVFQEPPQHTRKGRGVTVEPGTQLIDAATGPDLAPGTVVIPSATAWRRPSAEVSLQPRVRSNTGRSVRRVAQSHLDFSSATESPTPPADPFAPNSLLASSNRRTASQNKSTSGHGVATGDRHATRPMLDMTIENPFAEGSLLRQV